jgi:hypothetical protein
VGVNVFKHVCEEDGVTVSYFFKSGEEHCTDDIDTPPTCCKKDDKKNDCCEDQVEYIKLKLDYYNVESETAQQLQFAIFGSDGIDVSKTPRIGHKISNYMHPPPLSGREILIFKQVLVI